VYPGKVVNITKFGAFINILPGRDGLLHISKIGGGKRIDRVEDVLELGQDIEVAVEDVDPNGKISLKMAGDAPAKEAKPVQEEAPVAEETADEAGSDDAAESTADDSAPQVVEASFEDAFSAELEGVHGDLGPASSNKRGGGGGRRRRDR